MKLIVDVLVPDVINAKEYASATCDKLYQSKETVTMTRYGFAFFTMSFMLKKMEEEAEKCRLWSKREITEIIKVFPDDADKDKVKDIVAKMAFARKPLVRMSAYFPFPQEATSHEGDGECCPAGLLEDGQQDRG